MFEQTGTVLPLADFLYGDVYFASHGERPARRVSRHSQCGRRASCHHLSFEQATIDWQIWIDAGADPVPRKLVIAYKTEDEAAIRGVVPQMEPQRESASTSFRFEAARGRDAAIDVAAMAPVPRAQPSDLRSRAGEERP